MSYKRDVSLLVPYKIKDGEVFVFLQKRSKTQKRLPDCFGFFGGGIEGKETMEDALIREIREELNFLAEGYKHFNSYEFEGGLKHIFVLEVDDDFEKHITVFEGDYGKFFNEEGILKEKKFWEEDRMVIKDIFKFLQA
ncbi:MAG: NUDIX domain-containing protein [Candidatus Pacebacteria bacterium]|nr:NUDIX domain-containing protein [Candidatus Paceibacterota bacterium]